MNAAIPERTPATEEISGLIERRHLSQRRKRLCVLRIKTKGHREKTTVVGSLPSVTAGEWLAHRASPAFPVQPAQLVR
jgi:hypothetical protein